MKNSILALTSASHCVNHMFWESLGPLLPFLIVAFDLTYTEAGRLGFVYSIFYGLFNYPSGHWSDRYGRRIFILLFLLISSFSTLLIAFSNSYLQLLLLFGLAGLGGGLYHPPGTALLSNAFSKEKRGTVLGLHASGGSLGILLAFVIVGTVGTYWSWRTALICLAAIGFGLAIVLRSTLWHVEETTRTSDTGIDIEDGASIGLWTLIKWIPLMLTFYCFAIFLFKGAYVWFPTYLKEVYGMSIKRAIILSVILPAIGIFSNYLMGIVSDKFGRRPSLVFVFSILTACFFLLWLGNHTILIPLLAIFGFFINSFSGIVNAYTRDYLPPHVMGRALGIIFTFSICVSSFAPYVMGAISDRFSLSTSMAFMGAVSFMGALMTYKTSRNLKRSSRR